MTAENYRVFYDDHSAYSFTISVRDGDSKVVLCADASSISPRVEYFERRSFAESLAKRIFEAINRGGKK